MAKPASSKALKTTKPAGTAIATIDSELAKDIANIADQIRQPTGQRIKVEAGKFLLPDGTSLGNQLSFVIVDFVNANKYYPDQYVPGVVKPPICLAYDKVIKTMAPLDESAEKQNDVCSTCWANQFKSSPSGSGKGKACKNTKELAIVIDAPDSGFSLDDENPTLFALSIPPTSLANVDGAIGLAAKMVGHPIKAVFTVELEVVGTYSLYQFSSEIRPNKNYAVHAGLRAQATDMIVIKPDYEAAEARNAQAAPAKGPPRRPSPPARKAAGAGMRR